MHDRTELPDTPLQSRQVVNVLVPITPLLVARNHELSRGKVHRRALDLDTKGIPVEYSEEEIVLDPTVELVDDDSRLAGITFPPERGLVTRFRETISLGVFGERTPSLASTRGSPVNLNDGGDRGVPRPDKRRPGGDDPTLELERRRRMLLKQLSVALTSLDRREKTRKVIPARNRV